MSARRISLKRDECDSRSERDALAAVLARHAPRGAVRVAEALAAAACNRKRRAGRVWSGAFAPPSFEAMFAALPEQPIGARADAAWNAICRRIAARALAGRDPVAGAHHVALADAPPPEAHALRAIAMIGPFVFYRER